VGCLLVGAGVGAFFLCGSRSVERTSGPISHEAYVWQRVWTDEVRQAVEASREDLSRLVVLAAEVSWQDGRFAPARVEPDLAFLTETDTPVSLAIRIGAVSGGITTADQIEALSDLAADVVAEARAAGVTVDELQIDYDCAESKLDGYRKLIAAIGGRLPDCDVVITALPSWLDNGPFKSLAQEAGRYVLQVHSLVLPTSIDDIPPLCDPAKARKWVEQAARIGVPFRVALPTYGYLLAFDADGEYVGLAGSGGGPSTAGVRYVPLRTHAADMAALVSDWSQDRPAAMTGVIWYRLPVAGERMNWQWSTLQAVMKGRCPQADLQAIVRSVEPGLVEIDLRNVGNARAALDVAVAVAWTGDGPIASDGVGGFALSRAAANELLAVPRGAGELSAGERRMIAWLRFADDREVTADVEPLED